MGVDWFGAELLPFDLAIDWLGSPIPPTLVDRGKVFNEF